MAGSAGLENLVVAARLPGIAHDVILAERTPHVSIQIGYLYDNELREAENSRGHNYWYSYVPELLDELGLKAAPVPFCDATPDGLRDVRVLMIGDHDVSLLRQDTEERLREWVEAGGILIGFKTTGLDDLFGVAQSLPEREAAPFTIAGWMCLKGRDETSGLLDELLPETDCPIMSPFRRLKVTDAVSLTNIVESQASEAAGGATGNAFPAITRRSIGRGKAYYFAFNLPQAVWTYHQGRPIESDFDGDGFLRAGDAIIVRSGPAATVPCADLIMLVLENIIAPAGVPFIHQLPPSEGRLPDALFHYGGDDEANAGLQGQMSDIMRSLGLAYHVNVMLGADGAFHFSDADRAVYEKNGHEFSLHFDFINYPEGAHHPAAVDETEYDRQFRLFVERYGKTPVCANCHWCRASGWADTARFGARRGTRGDNSYVHHTSPPLNPVNMFGAPFGTVYPYFMHDDFRHGNERLRFVNIPISLYEPGTIAGEKSHPLHGQDPFRPDEYRRLVDLACRYGWTLDVFLHPPTVCHPQNRCKEALRCMLDRIAEIGAHVLHVGTDAVCLWWHARSGTRVELEEDKASYAVETTFKDGVFVRFLADALSAGTAFELDGQSVPAVRRERRGKIWFYVAVPAGKHALRARGGRPRRS